MSRTLLAARLRTTLYLEQRPEGPVVLKVLAPGASADDEQRLDNDLSMSRDFVKSCLDAGSGRTTVDGRPALILEYVEGNALGARGHEPDGGARGHLEIGVLLARALAELHAQRIVHRDVKPSNVVSTQRPTSWCSSISVWRRACTHRSVRCRRAPSSRARSAYLAPEQSEAHGQSVDERADLHALGARLDELFAGRPPFRGHRSGADRPRAPGSRTPVPIHLENPAVPETVSKIVAIRN